MSRPNAGLFILHIRQLDRSENVDVYVSGCHSLNERQRDHGLRYAIKADVDEKRLEEMDKARAISYA